MPVTVVTDTTHYLPGALAAEHGIQSVSLYVNWPDGQEREGDMATFDAFYERLGTSAELPTTSQPSIGDFLAVYEPLLAAGQDIVSIHISGGVSGTAEAARQAAGQCPPGRIEVIDSETGAGGMALILLAAAAVANNGGDLTATIERAREARVHTRIWFAVETLEFLQRGGRIGKAQAMVGGALQIKPILSIESQIYPVGRVRTSARAFDRLVDMLRERQADGADGWVVAHIQAAEKAQRLVDAGREIFGTEPVFVSELGPVIGAHVGPGIIGVGGCPAALLQP